MLLQFPIVTLEEISELHVTHVKVRSYRTADLDSASLLHLDYFVML